MALSEAEWQYCVHSIQQGLRLDGRGCNDFRPIEVELGLIAQASGSARLHLGATDVIVGVKVEVGSPKPDYPDCGRLQINVEASSCASPDYEGRGGEAWGAELARALETSLIPSPPGKGHGIDLTALSIIRGKTCWIVFIDALILNDDGSVLDALSWATRAALANARIPKVDIIMGENDEEPELELDDNMANSMQLNLSNVPVMVSVSQVGHACVVDLTSQEEACAMSTLHVSVSSWSQIYGMTMEGLHGVGPSMLAAMLELVQKLGPQIILKLDECCSQHGKT